MRRAILIAALLSGCGATLQQKVNTANDAAAQIRKVIGPQLNKACLAKANECKARGVPVAEECAPLVKCRTVRDAFYAAVQGVHIAAASFRVAEVAGKPTAELGKILEQARKALAEAWALASKSGYVTSP
jgi:hypothetical protein